MATVLDRMERLAAVLRHLPEPAVVSIHGTEAAALFTDPGTRGDIAVALAFQGWLPPSTRTVDRRNGAPVREHCWKQDDLLIIHTERLDVPAVTSC